MDCGRLLTHIHEPPQSPPRHPSGATFKIAMETPVSVNVADCFEILDLLSTSSIFHSIYQSNHSGACPPDDLRNDAQGMTMLILGRRSVPARGGSRHTIRTMRRWMVGWSQHRGATLMIRRCRDGGEGREVQGW